jgi:hypothetical protein
VPAALRRRVFNQLHGIVHPGVRATRRLLAARFVWPAMAADVAVWCRDCVACNRAKVTRHVQAPVQQMEVPRRRFSHIHVDLVGPLPVSKEGFTHLFTVVDRSTRWPEDRRLGGSPHQRMGGTFRPADISSDRGVQFSSGVWAGLCQRLGISHHSTTAYHPQSNGMVERFHRQLKDALRACLRGQDWVSQLPWVLLGLRSAPKEKANISSAEMVYRTALTLSGEFLEAEVERWVEKLRSDAASFSPPSTASGPVMEAAEVPQQLQSCQHVYVRGDGARPPSQDPEREQSGDSVCR